MALQSSWRRGPTAPGAAALVWCLLVVPAASGQVTECWDLPYSTVEIGIGQGQSATLLVIPDGSGPGFAAGATEYGTNIDVSVTLTLIDCDFNPVVHFPAEDLWLATVDAGLAICPGGTVADADTDADGVATWTLPLRAGGYSQAGCLVYVSGSALNTPPLPLEFNSPDLDGNLNVNIADLSTFAGDFFGPYRFRSDLARDGVVNILDLARMAEGFGRSCP